MSSSAERLLSARMLVRVEGGAFASRLLAGSAAPGVRARVLGVLRWQRLLDETIGPLCRRGLGALDPEVRVVLRLGLFEACRLGVPPPVATDAAVHLVRRLAKTSAAGMVNAVLRRAVPRHRQIEDQSPADVRLSHPEWLFSRWVVALGEPAALEVMSVDQTPAPVWVWFGDDSARKGLERSGVELVAHPWCPGAWAAPGAESALLDVVVNGGAYVQDPTSQLVAHLAARLVHEQGSVLDLCSAPGGKLALLGCLRPWRRACAIDVHPQRAVLTAGLLDRHGLRDHTLVLVADSRRPPVVDASWDLVVVDAPCSGTGTLRRHPDLRWRLSAGSIESAAELQSALLSSALDLVAPGGAVLYSTCSIEPEENEDLVSRHDHNPVDLAPYLEGVPWQSTTSGGVRILPHQEGDGFTLHAVRA